MSHAKNYVAQEAPAPPAQGRQGQSETLRSRESSPHDKLPALAKRFLSRKMRA